MTTLPTPEIEDGKIYCPLLDDWLLDKPEERVRQAFVLHLNEHYKYAFGQMRQEQRIQSGTRSARVDIAVWTSVEDAKRSPRPAPVLVVECKAEAVDIHRVDYYQGESYARSVGEPCEFLVMHNARQTEFYRLRRGLPGELVQVNDIPHAADWGDAGRLDKVRHDLRVFSRRQFQNLLRKCHDVLRDNHKMSPGPAFDTISKVLFVKMYVERTGTHGTFTTDFLDRRERTRLDGDPPVHEQLFTLTKRHYSDDEIFAGDDSLDISEGTFRRLVKELERFNLSATGDDVKGLAFERFLGQTFRGELGQYFTPRPVVDFMVEVLDPEIDDLICDPAAGSGGFLIRVFEHVRAKIEGEVEGEKLKAKAEIEARGLPEAEEEAAIDEAFAALNRDLDPDQADPPSPLHRLSRDHVFGTDAEPRAARTAKMNMIMHGDGHGGIHYHDGLVDVNGIFPGRFDVVLSNPPFGSTVGDDQTVGETEQTRGPSDPKITRRARARYGAAWEAAHRAFQAAEKDGKRTNKKGDLPVLSLFDIGLGKGGQKTELLFLERCLQLLKPGGRLGVVLPDGNLNNPSAQWADVRRWAEGRARLMAVVSLPPETFSGAKATVKASVVFMRRFTTSDEAAWERAWDDAHGAHDGAFAAERDAAVAEHAREIVTGGDPAVGHLLDALADLGAGLTDVGWRLDEPPPYPRGRVSSSLVGAKYRPLPKGPKNREAKREAKALRDRVKAAWTNEHEAAAKRAQKALRKALRRADAAHRAALWDSVREAFDYPVFTAAPSAVGVTSTGEVGPSELGAVLADWRAFEAWVAAGARADEAPTFAADAGVEAAETETAEAEA